MDDDAPSAVQSGDAQVRFDARVYPLAVIKKASYRFLRTFVADISQEGDQWICTLTFQAPTDAAGAALAVRNLKTEVLDQDLRESIGRETEQIRNTILAVAFSRTGLQRSE